MSLNWLPYYQSGVYVSYIRTLPETVFGTEEIYQFEPLWINMNDFLYALCTYKTDFIVLGTAAFRGGAVERISEAAIALLNHRGLSNKTFSLVQAGTSWRWENRAAFIKDKHGLWRLQFI